MWAEGRLVIAVTILSGAFILGRPGRRSGIFDDGEETPSDAPKRRQQLVELMGGTHRSMSARRQPRSIRTSAAVPRPLREPSSGGDDGRSSIPMQRGKAASV